MVGKIIRTETKEDIKKSIEIIDRLIKEADEELAS